MKRLCTFLLALLIHCLTASSVTAQTNAAVTDQAPFFAAALSEFLTDSRSFTAAAELQVGADAAEGATKIPFGVAMLDGKMRCEFDLKNLAGGALPPEASDWLKQLGLDRFGVILRPDTNATLIAYGAKTYADIPLPKSSAIQDRAEAHIGHLEKIRVGTELVDGLPADKFKLTVPGEKDKEAYVWQAPHLKDMPIRLQVKISGQVYQMSLRNVRLLRPDARVFGVPANFIRVDGVEGLLQSAALQSLGQAAKAAGQ